MKIAVLVKQVPDTWTLRQLDTTTGYVRRDTQEAVADEINERAVALAVQLRDVHGGTITAVTLGPSEAESVLRRALAMGADDAIHLTGPEFQGANTLQTAHALAQALSTLTPDLVIAGNRSTDGGGGVVPAMVGEILGMPVLSFLDEVRLSGSTITGIRSGESQVLTVEATLPAVVSVTEMVDEAPIPNFMGLMKAKKKPLRTLSRSDVGELPGGAATATQVARRPMKSTSAEVISADRAGALRIVEELKKRGVLS